MQYVKASEYAGNARPQMSRVFAQAFYSSGLNQICKDVDKLARAFEHTFILEHFYLAVNGEEIVGMAACSKRTPPPVKFEKNILTREFGFLRGGITYLVLNKHIVNVVYPFELAEEAGMIDFVATAPQHQGKGVAAGLLTHVMQAEPYAEYVLEVGDTNPAARLYKKLGFEEFVRGPAPKGSGFNHMLYMCRYA